MYNDFKLANYPNALLSPELYARHLSRLYTGNVIDGLTCTPGTGLQVVLAAGTALIQYGTAAVASARLVSLVATFNLTIGTADVSNPRIDLVVLYIDNAVSLPSGTPTSANLDGLGVAKAKIVQGTAASSPVAPNATAIQASVGAGNPYTVLEQVRVDAGVSVIASNKITDVRSMAYSTAKVGSSNIDWTTFLTRQDNTTNSNVANAKIKTGWGWILGTGAARLSETVTFDTAFSVPPIVLITYGGDANSTTPTYGGGTLAVRASVAAFPHTITTSGFTALIQTVDASVWSTSQSVYYQWIAIGA